MDKWIAIMIVGVIVGMFAPLMVMEYEKGNCRIEAIRAGMPADDILKLCK
jgi:uncharacterized membrane protein YeaQ/YmgE (transglycosylase-associated protein family)